MTQLSDAKRDAILAAATRSFLAEGYSAVSMDAIALAAPVSKPTLYNYFPGKSALFAAVVAHVCQRMTAAVDAARPTPPATPPIALIAPPTSPLIALVRR